MHTAKAAQFPHRPGETAHQLPRVELHDFIRFNRPVLATSAETVSVPLIGSVAEDKRRLEYSNFV